MKRLVIHSLTLLFMAVCSINASAQNEEKRSAEEFHDFTDKQYRDLLSKVHSLHRKGPRTYFREHVVEMGYRDMFGVDPIMIVVHHNQVDLMVTSSKGKITRLSFSRVTGVWSPKNTLWTISLIPEDAVEPKKLWSTNLGMTDSEYSRDQLYRKYLQGTEEAEQGSARQPATGVESKAEGKEKPKQEPKRRPQ